MVTDIDRGGSFAALYGTVALLEPADQALIAGFVINKFRGARALLDPGLDMITGLTGRPVLGVLPWAPGLWLDAEDSLALDPRPGAGGRGRRTAGDVLRVSVVRLPRISNFTDIDALAAEPGVLVRLAGQPGRAGRRRPGRAAGLPGHGGRPGLAARRRASRRRIAERARKGLPVLGICGGYQMLATADRRRGRVAARAGWPGWACCRPGSRSRPDKTLGRPAGTAYGAAGAPGTRSTTGSSR